MFIFTAKFNKKKAIIIVLILGIILCGIILIAGNRSRASETSALSAVVKNNEQRVEFLKSLGWEVNEEPIDEQVIVIPREFSDVYSSYNEIQIEQGFDLARYGGIEATRYTYEILNYPDTPENVVADIIVYRNRVIAGDIQCFTLDGFMHGLKKADTAPE